MCDGVCVVEGVGALWNVRGKRYELVYLCKASGTVNAEVSRSVSAYTHNGAVCLAPGAAVVVSINCGRYVVAIVTPVNGSQLLEGIL